MSEKREQLKNATKVSKCVGEENICKMWQTHYQTLLNSAKTTEHKERVLPETAEMSNSSQITFTLIDISSAFKLLKIGKACGVDSVSAEHFLYIHDILHVFLSLLFTFFITRGHLPSNFMKTALVHIIKNKTDDNSDKNNYRPIALVTAASKNLKSVF